MIKLENGSNSFIFTGDAEETSEQDMISTGMNLDCDVLSIGHHGSASSTTWDFLEATSPSYAVISCGVNNQYNHPSAETMGRLSDMEIPVFRTDKQGTIIAVSDGTTINWSQNPCNDYSSGDSPQIHLVTYHLTEHRTMKKQQFLSRILCRKILLRQQAQWYGYLQPEKNIIVSRIVEE